MKKIIILIVTIAVAFIFLNACEKKDKQIPITKESLQGKWVDNGENHFGLGGIEHYFEFNNDEYKLHVYEYTDLAIVSLEDSTGTDTYNKYMKGNFSIKNNTIFLNGNYYDMTYQFASSIYSDSLVLELTKKNLSFRNKIGTKSILLKIQN